MPGFTLGKIINCNKPFLVQNKNEPLFSVAILCGVRLKERLTLKSAGRLAVKQTGEGTSELRITTAQRSDTGLYACKIVNEFGTKQCDFKLEVKGERPSPALQGTISCGDITTVQRV